MTFVFYLKWPCVPLMVGLANSPFLSLLTNISELCKKSANSSAKNWHPILEHHPLLVIEVPFYLSEMFKLETQGPFYSPPPPAFSTSDTVTSASSSGNSYSEFTSYGSSAVGRTFLFFSPTIWSTAVPPATGMGQTIVGSGLQLALTWTYSWLVPSVFSASFQLLLYMATTAQFRQKNLLLVPQPNPQDAFPIHQFHSLFCAHLYLVPGHFSMQISLSANTLFHTFLTTSVMFILWELL